MHVHLEWISVNVLAVFNMRGLLRLPAIFPQTTVSTANVHRLPSLGRSVQVIVVWLVVVEQLPQFDARMLYWMEGQSGATGLQLNVISFRPKLTRAKEISSGGAMEVELHLGMYIA